MSSTRIEELEAQVESLSRRLKSWVDARGKVWVVRYSNYDPPEVDSVWLTKELAEARRLTFARGRGTLDEARMNRPKDNAPNGAPAAWLGRFGTPADHARPSATASARARYHIAGM